MNYCNELQSDGFGSQYQNIIAAILFTENNDKNFMYDPIRTIEHNYENDTEFIDKIENLMNIKKNYINVNNNAISICGAKKQLDANINTYINSESMCKIKKCFWENKNKNYFNNNKINIAIHIRRPNINDNRIEGTNTSDKYYLDIMHNIRAKYTKENILFHIYSQGNPENFKCYCADDVIFHINKNIFDTFIEMVAANILVMSASSFSYAAALISDGVIFYHKFWHAPANSWICE